MTRLQRRVVLNPPVTRAVILMGPNTRYTDPSVADVLRQSLLVTIDIGLLFVCKP